MKRYVHGNRSGIDSVDFGWSLTKGLQKLLPRASVEINSQYNEITITATYSDLGSKVKRKVQEALEREGYEVVCPNTEDCEIAAIQGDEFVRINVDDFGHDEAYVYLNYDNGNVMFADWYDEFFEEV